MGPLSGCSPGEQPNQRIHRGGDLRAALRRAGAGLAANVSKWDDSHYDNAHENTKGHELHVAGQPTQTIQFPGMVALWQRFWSEVPKAALDPTN
jgi:hypothetical protein